LRPLTNTLITFPSIHSFNADRYSTEEKFIKVPIRGQETKVAVFMDVEPKGAKIYIATVDLERLGRWVKGQRKKGKMQHLYVLGQIPHGLDQLNEETEA
jgi:hypothetical protein